MSKTIVTIAFFFLAFVACYSAYELYGAPDFSSSAASVSALGAGPSEAEQLVADSPVDSAGTVPPGVPSAGGVGIPVDEESFSTHLQEDMTAGEAMVHSSVELGSSSAGVPSGHSADSGHSGRAGEPHVTDVAVREVSSAISSATVDSLAMDEKQHNTASEAHVNLVDGKESVANTPAQLKSDGVVRATFTSGDSLASVLGRYGVSAREVYNLTCAMKPEFSPRDFRPKDALELRFIADTAKGKKKKQLQSVAFIPERDILLTLSRNTDGSFESTKTPLPHIRTLRFVTGKVGKSGFLRSAIYAGIPRLIALEMIRAVGPRMHLASSKSRYARFEVLFEEFDDGPERGGKHYGKVLFLSVNKKISKTQMQTVRLYRYTTPSGFEGYFDEEGIGAETLYSQIPVDGGQLTSLMGRRKHPVLKKWRTHKGLDYCAKRNAPIHAVADGVVEYKGRNGGYGRYIKIRHADGHYTAYAHLSRYAEGVKSGSTVNQGQIIGYVGSSGIATGPNLHYEVHDAQRRIIDPLQADGVSLYSVAKDETARFQAALLYIGKELAGDNSSPERVAAAERLRESIRSLQASANQPATVSTTMLDASGSASGKAEASAL